MYGSKVGYDQIKGVIIKFTKIMAAANKETKPKEETYMALTAFLICVAVGLSAGLMKSISESMTE
ncbi:MAG: hypothetical protein IKR73_08065 [Oscillospiraceae bacterium]|nr:hypothetical protein [Oscillospiraceae bacterium]